MQIITNEIFPAPEPVLKEFQIKGGKSKKLFRRFGAVRFFKANGELLILRSSGFERAYKKTQQKKKAGVS